MHLQTCKRGPSGQVFKFAGDLQVRQLLSARSKMAIKPDYRNPSANSRPKSPPEQKTERSYLEARGALGWTNGSAEPLNNLISGASFCLYNFFHDNGYMIVRGEWESSGINSALKSYVGWVYAFYGEEDIPIYVGETNRAFGVRFNEHKRKSHEWWPFWTRVKVLPCPNQTVRKIFESLIGLAGGYVGNRAQPQGTEDLFNEVVLSLLALGNHKEAKPLFNNSSICGYANLAIESTKETKGN